MFETDPNASKHMLAFFGSSHLGPSVRLHHFTPNVLMTFFNFKTVHLNFQALDGDKA